MGDTSALLHSVLQALLRETSPLVHSPVESVTNTSNHQHEAEDDDRARDDGGSKRTPPSDDLSGSSREASHAKRQRKKPDGEPKPQRVPTYYLRKTEVEALRVQLEALKEQFETLKSGNQQQEQQQAEERSRNSDQLTAVTVEKQVENAMLRDAVQLQQLSFARMQSAFGRNLSAQACVPFGSFIRLGRDSSERNATLLAMKDEKLRSAQRYIAARTRFIDPSEPFFENSRFNSSAGDLQAMHFDVIPFEGVKSVQQVFDAVLFYGLNIEISISEVLGDITIREDDGVREHGILHSRLISSVQGVDAQLEANTVMFCQLHEPMEGFGGGHEFGVVAADFIDEDELYPYSPGTRLRHDVTAALTITLEPHKTVNALGEIQEELVVVVTRAAFLKLHRTEMPIPPHVMQELHARVEGWGDAMMKTLRGILYPDSLRSGASRDSSQPPPRSHRFTDPYKHM